MRRFAPGTGLRVPAAAQCSRSGTAACTSQSTAFLALAPGQQAACALLCSHTDLLCSIRACTFARQTVAHLYVTLLLFSGKPTLMSCAVRRAFHTAVLAGMRTSAAQQTDDKTVHQVLHLPIFLLHLSKVVCSQVVAGGCRDRPAQYSRSSLDGCTELYNCIMHALPHLFLALAASPASMASQAGGPCRAPTQHHNTT